MYYMSYVLLLFIKLTNNHWELNFIANEVGKDVNTIQDNMIFLIQKAMSHDTCVRYTLCFHPYNVQWSF
jgi:hypothetical protein